jgi:hypothetical protein
VSAKDDLMEAIVAARVYGQFSDDEIREIVDGVLPHLRPPGESPLTDEHANRIAAVMIGAAMNEQGEA